MTFTNQDLDGAIADLGMLKFFPSDATVQGSIKAYLAKLCPHKKALLWLVVTLVNQTGEWPGPAEVRRVLASRYRPADGDEGDQPQLASEDVHWQKFPSHADERARLPQPAKLLSAAECVDLATVPDRPAEQIFGEVLDHFSKPWPAGHARTSGELHALEEQLALDKAAATPLTESQKASRIAEIESILGFTG